MKIRFSYREQTNGIAVVATYVVNNTRYRTCFLFPYGVAPKLFAGENWESISEPERFGAYSTAKERRAYMRNFIKRFENRN